MCRQEASTYSHNLYIKGIYLKYVVFFWGSFFYDGIVIEEALKGNSDSEMKIM